MNICNENYLDNIKCHICNEQLFYQEWKHDNYSDFLISCKKFKNIKLQSLNGKIIHLLFVILNNKVASFTMKYKNNYLYLNDHDNKVKIFDINFNIMLFSTIISNFQLTTNYINDIEIIYNKLKLVDLLS